jgi:hypothetical protein
MEELHIRVNYRMNPADFFMLEISTMKELEGYVTPLNSEAFRSKQVHSKDYFLEASQDSFI